MDGTSTHSTVTGHLTLYAGRFLDGLTDAGLPGDCDILSEWDVPSTRLDAVVERASTLIVLDLFSFPFEAMTGVRQDVPLILVLPSGFDAGFLITVFGTAVFERLTFFDRVATWDDDLWEELRQRYRWAENQRIQIRSGRLDEVAREIHTLLEAESAVQTFFGDSDYEASRYWNDRGDALAESAPHRAICSVHHDQKFNKAMHRIQAATLEPQFAAAWGGRAEDAAFDVLEVGVGIGRWASSFDLAKTRFVGVDISEGMVNAARANFPEGHFDRLGPDLLLPYGDESFDLVFSVTVMHHNPTPAKRILLSEMWRVTRPGGQLMFLEDFVVGKGSARSPVYRMSILKFVDLVLEATAGQVVLDHVESLRYRHDDMARSGLLSLSKVGVPRTW